MDAPKPETVEIATLPHPSDCTPATVPPGSLLTELQRQFCIARFKGATETDAYIVACPTVKNRKEARNRGRKLARLPKVQEFMRALRDQTLDYSDVSTTQVQGEITRVAFSDIRQLFDAAGEILPVEKWPAAVAAAVSSYEEEVSANGLRLKRKIKMWDKPGALKLLADIKGMTNAKPDATQRATFTFNFGSAKGAPRGRMGGRVIDADRPSLLLDHNAPKA